MNAKKSGSRRNSARALLRKLGIKSMAGYRYVLPAAVGIAAGILAGAVAVQVVGLSVVAGIAVGVVAAGYTFTKVAEMPTAGCRDEALTQRDHRRDPRSRESV